MSSKEKFVQYYADQNILEPCEFESFLHCIEQPLPITFWFNVNDVLNRHFEQTFKHIGGTENKMYMKKIPWIPHFQTWSIDISRKNLRKDEALSKLHSTIVQYTEAGHVWRQEEVSMLSPLLLNIQKGDVVLDMCAAPGSKTAQLLTLLSSKNKVYCATDRESSKFNPACVKQTYCADSGCIVANEVNIKRLNMLIYRMKRLHSSFPYAIFTNHDARQFPEPKSTEFLFNKILCDVPCSGDGTLRKNPHVFRSWNEKNAYSLNPLQIEIAFKAATLLCVGGTMVYSTCSLNPIENEAVIYHLKKICGGALELVNPESYSFLSYTSKTNKFKVRPGLNYWRVNKDLAGQKRRECSNSFYLRGDTFSAPNTEDLELLKSIRVYPQDQNTGGFFIAILKKVRDIQYEYFGPMYTPCLNYPCVQKTANFPCNYVPVDEHDAESILSFYQIGGRSTSISHRNLISHRKKHSFNGSTEISSKDFFSRTFGYVSESVYNIITSPHIGWKIENAGLRLFTIDRNKRQEKECFRWRICNESVDLLLISLICNRLDKQGMKYSGLERFVELDVFSALKILNAPNKTLDLKDFLPSLTMHNSENLKNLSPGGLIFYVLYDTGVIGFSAIIATRSIQASVSKADLQLYITALREIEKMS